MNTKFELRDYQKECREIILNDDKNKLIWIATGGGKTIIFNTITIEAINSGERVLIIVPSIEILTQVKENLFLLKPALNLSVIQGKNRDTTGDVVIATRQTLSKKTNMKSGLMDELLENGTFKYIIIDEVHEAPKQIMSIYNHNKNSIFLGFTATPYNVRLDEVFPDGISYDARITYLMEEGYLCGCEVIRKITKTDITDVSIISEKRKDYATQELQDKINNDTRNNLIVNTILQVYNERKSIIVYCSGLEHVETLTKMLKLHNLNVDSIDGNTNKKKRADIIERFKSNKIRILVNCNVLTTGFDCPITDCIIFAAPTKSKTVYAQRLGRGLRPHPDKQNCLLIEFVDINNTFDTIQIQDVLNDDSLDISNIMKKDNLKCENTSKLYNLKSNIKIKNGIENYNWIKEDFGYILFLSRKEALIITRNTSGLYNVYITSKESGSLNFNNPSLKMSNIKSLDEAIDDSQKYIAQGNFKIDLSYLDKDDDENKTDLIQKRIISNVNIIKESFKSINYIPIS